MEVKSVVRASRLDVTEIEGKKNHSNMHNNNNNNNNIVRTDSIFLHPKIIAEYIQLSLNILITLFILYFVMHLFLMLKNDVQSKINQIVRFEINKVKICEKNYLQNQCDPALRVPALEELCSEWFECINNGNILTNKSYYSFKSAKLWVQTIAEIINTFVDEIKFKAFAFLLISILFSVIIINTTFSSLISSYSNENSKQH